ncbi:MAG: UDP-N-acetylglucosamine 1-carboxyvinyltransferase [Alphaproteobacteria bacterium]|nr:UDP-N-acetylglucosamine 1-carboxyvinyltransferase [Alphaproteobacteria bacterium]
MDRILIRGGACLNGEIEISGAKNAALPLMCASILTDEVLKLRNMPHLADIDTMGKLLMQLGVSMTVDHGPMATSPNTANFSTKAITDYTAPYELVRKMRASILVLGPLVARCGKAKVSLPGGCALGTRPVDLHIKGLQQLGAEIDLQDGYIIASAPNGLKGAEIFFPVVTVTGTENLLMAACLAKGETKLVNAAREPEVTDLAECLVKMGAEISGIGTGTLVIQGKDKLHGADHAIVADRIVVGTYAIAAAITNGDVELIGARAEHIQSVMAYLEQVGVSVTTTEDGLRVKRSGGMLRSVDITTEPYPGFPTDMQAQAMALMCLADGASVINETIFENRFMHVPELSRLGANITVNGTVATVRGVSELHGAPVMATDLRASVSLVLAGLAAKGETIVSRVYHLDRGYDHVEQKLAACGANIERLKAAA